MVLLLVLLLLLPIRFPIILEHAVAELNLWKVRTTTVHGRRRRRHFS